MEKKHFLFFSLVIFLSLNLSAQIDFKKSDKLKTSSEFYAVQIADINNDGLDDVIGATEYSWESGEDDAKIIIFLQDTLGKLNRRVMIDYPKQYPGVKSLAIGYLNNDSLKDIVIAYSDSIGITYQTSPGNFSAFDSYYCYSMADQVLCQDLNHDSLTDIVVKNNQYDSYLSIFYQTQSGFNKQVVQNPKHYAYKMLETGDFNTDGYSDLIYYSSYVNADPSLFIMINDSLNGLTEDSFTLQYSNKVGYLNSLTVSDLNNDGYPDILGLNRSNDSVYIWTNSQNGYDNIKKIQTDEYSDRLGTADFNCDCFKEILVISGFSVSTQESADNYKKITTNNVPEQYSSPTNWYNQYSIGDLNNDNRKDIAIAYLDGIVIMQNTSKPASFSSIDTVSITDTLVRQLDTLQYKTRQRIKIGISNKSFVYRLDSLDVILYQKEENVVEKTILIRKGTICNKPFLDSLSVGEVDHFRYISRYDSLIFYSSFDTVPIISAIDDVEENEFRIFPNPANEYISLLFPVSEDNSKIDIEVLSLSGQCVLKRSDFNNSDNPVSININDLKRGIYLMKIHLKDKVIVKKLLKN